MSEYELRGLDPVVDEERFREAYQWILDGPTWVRQIEGVVATVNGCYSVEDYLKTAKNPTEYNVGLFNGRLRALFTIQDQRNGSFEVHVGAASKVDRYALVAGATRLREWLFANGARSVYGFLPSVNRPMKKFAKEAGFRYSGISVFRGSLNGRVIRWQRFEAIR